MTPKHSLLFVWKDNFSLSIMFKSDTLGDVIISFFKNQSVCSDRCIVRVIFYQHINTLSRVPLFLAFSRVFSCALLSIMLLKLFFLFPLFYLCESRFNFLPGYISPCLATASNQIWLMLTLLRLDTKLYRSCFLCCIIWFGNISYFVAIFYNI